MTRSSMHFFTGFLFGLVLLVAPVAGGDGIEITGQVVDEAGRPLAKAMVELEELPSFYEASRRMLAGEDPAPVVASTRTGKDGGLRITAPEAGMWRVVVRHPRHLEMACALRPVLASLALPAVTLPRRVERQVRIVDEAGKPVAAARIFAHGWLRGTEYLPPFDWRSAFRYGTSAEDGTVRVASTTGETLRLAGRAGERFGDQVFEPGAGDVTLRLPKMVDARVVDEAGRPLTGLVGLVYGPFPVGVTTKQGDLRIPRLPKHKLTLLFVDAAGFVGGVSRTLTAEEVAGPPVVLRLPPAVEVDIRVVDAIRREPIAEAWLWTFDDFYRTDGHGSFRLRVPQSGAWQELWVAAEGYIAAATNPSPQKLPGGELVVALEPSLRLAGTVTDSDGHAVDGAEIRARPLVQRLVAGAHRLHPRELHTAVVARSGADGHFSLVGLRPAFGYELRVGRRGYAPWRAQVPSLDPAVAPEILEITLTAGIEAAGLVLDADGQPVPGARVVLEEAPGSTTAERRSAGKASRYETGAGADGRFRFSDLPPATFVLDARAPGFAPRTVPGIEIAADSTDLGKVSLRPVPSVHGRVTDVAGAGIAGARVSVSARQPEINVAAVTGADGSFIGEGLPPDTRFSVTVWSPGYVTENHQQMTFDPERPLEIVLEKSRTLTGQVVDADGEAVAGARVQLETLRLGFSTSSTSHGSDTDGRFRFTVAPTTTVRILASSPAGIADPVEVKVSDEGEIPEVRVVMRPATSLAGRITGPDGMPVFDALVDLDPLFKSQVPDTDFGLGLNLILTDAEGRFAITSLEGGSYRLRAEHPEYEPLEERLELAAGVAEEIDLAFAERRDFDRLKVRGRIVGDGGDGIDGAAVRLVKDWGGQAFAETSSFGDGRFELVAVEAGTYSVLAAFGGLAPGRTEPFQVGDGAVEDIVLHLLVGAAIRGRISGLEPERLAGVQLTAGAPEYGSFPGRVRSDGSFRVSGLAVGGWTITARLASDGRSVSRHVIVAEPGGQVEAEVELRFEPAFRLAGQVLRDGAPLTDGELEIRCPGSSLNVRVAIHDGRFVHHGVPAGSCALRARDRRLGARAVARQVEVDGDTDVMLDFTTAVLTGRVATRGGREPVTGAVVYVQEPGGGGSISHTETGADGRFEQVVESGRAWLLQVSATGFARASATVVVERPGREVEIFLEAAVPDER